MVTAAQLKAYNSGSRAPWKNEQARSTVNVFTSCVKFDNIFPTYGGRNVGNWRSSCVRVEEEFGQNIGERYEKYLCGHT